MAAETVDFIRNKITNWVKNRIYVKRSDAIGYCNRLVVRHLRADGVANSEVYTHIIEEPVTEMTPHDLDLLLGELATAMSEHASGLPGGVQSYGINAYYSNHQGSIACLTVRVQSDQPEMSATGMPTEPANQDGVLAMQMRHNESIMRTSVMAMGGVVQALQKNLDRFAHHNERLIDDRMNTLHLIEDLMSGKHERDLETERQKNDLRLREELLDKLKLLGPYVINKMMGKSVLPEQTTPEALQIRALVETLRPEQMEKLKDVLTPDQLLAIVEIAGKMVTKSGENPENSNVPALGKIAQEELQKRNEGVQAPSTG